MTEGAEDAGDNSGLWGGERVVPNGMEPETFLFLPGRVGAPRSAQHRPRRSTGERHGARILYLLDDSRWSPEVVAVTNTTPRLFPITAATRPGVLPMVLPHFINGQRPTCPIAFIETSSRDRCGRWAMSPAMEPDRLAGCPSTVTHRPEASRAPGASAATISLRVAGCGMVLPMARVSGPRLPGPLPPGRSPARTVPVLTRFLRPATAVSRSCGVDFIVEH